MSTSNLVFRSACEACTRSKIKCTGGDPCAVCVRRGIHCHYLPQLKRGPRKEQTEAKYATTPQKRRTRNRSNKGKGNATGRKRVQLAAKQEVEREGNSLFRKVKLDAATHAYQAKAVATLNRFNVNYNPKLFGLDHKVTSQDFGEVVNMLGTDDLMMTLKTDVSQTPLEINLDILYNDCEDMQSYPDVSCSSISTSESVFTKTENAFEDNLFMQYSAAPTSFQIYNGSEAAGYPRDLFRTNNCMNMFRSN